MACWALDLDGVVWLADEPILGSAAAIETLRARGDEVVFVSNNSYPTVAAYVEKLAAHGISAEGDVITSAMAAAHLVDPGERVLVLGGPGVREAVESRQATIVDDGDADAVLVGFHRDFTYERMRIAATAVRRGARLLATNDDATYPTPDGPIPGAGSILAGVERASGVRATIAGKPQPPIVELVLARLGPTGTVVGDRPDTDGLLARALGYRFALVLSGVTAKGDVVDPAPDEVADDLGVLVARYR